MTSSVSRKASISSSTDSTKSLDASKLIDSQKCIRLGDEAPDFTCLSQQGPIHFHDYIAGSWCIFFSHPADFTPVCTTELGRAAQLTDEFAKRGCKMIALSVDSVENHHKWIKDIEEINNVKINYPILADTNRRVSVQYGMLNQEHLAASGLPLTVRSVFIIDKSKKVKTIITYPASTGRNFDELLRVIDSLQLAESHKLATPADWKKGKDCVVLPTVPTEEAHKLFPKGVKVVRPWLRTTPDPSAA